MLVVHQATPLMGAGVGRPVLAISQDRFSKVAQEVRARPLAPALEGLRLAVVPVVQPSLRRCDSQATVAPGDCLF